MPRTSPEQGKHGPEPTHPLLYIHWSQLQPGPGSAPGGGTWPAAAPASRSGAGIGGPGNVCGARRPGCQCPARRTDGFNCRITGGWAHGPRTQFSLLRCDGPAPDGPGAGHQLRVPVIRPRDPGNHRPGPADDCLDPRNDSPLGSGGLGGPFVGAIAVRPGDCAAAAPVLNLLTARERDGRPAGGTGDAAGHSRGSAGGPCTMAGHHGRARRGPAWHRLGGKGPSWQA